ncbi:MAG TPA: C10 family peptidase [Bacteroidales bacterium]|nr:C10 family peptidase [Bacteroidales bacterium]HPS16527.1 C10 family peptidase [Bacteroidales bacterium]
MKHKHPIQIAIIAFVFIFNIANAEKVDLKTAKNVAINSYQENYSNLYDKSADGIFITDEFLISENSQLLYYVFNTSNGGFIMVAADDIFRPVMGYSFESTYSNENQPPQFISWINMYKKEITEDVSLKLNATPDIESEWNKYKVNPEDFISTKGTKSVLPLVFSKWDQGGCYNTLCPADAAGAAGHCYVGCVATAMAQIMFYYRYPAQGQGTYSYNSQSYGQLSANFGATTYNWNAMTNTCNGTNDAIATISYHCGVAADMDYGTDGSGAWPSQYVQTLPANFKYSSNIKSADKSDYNDATWESMIRTEIDAKRPIEYSGFGDAGGHAFVLDGYQGTNYFHFNWGWSGMYDGYFYLTALNPGGSDFSNYQQMLYKIYPGTGYPSYCSGPVTLTAAVGSFTDGSGYNDYQNNSDCSWLISPVVPATVMVDHLVLNFDKINIENTNDVVTVYDGSTTSATLLGQYTGSTIPSQITSTSPEVLVTFNSNGSTVGEGWQISYYSVYPVFCTSTNILTDSTGTLSDGSGVYDYYNNASCAWDIVPAGAAIVVLHFNSFNLESGNDKVRVFDIENSATPLGVYTGNTIPSDVSSPSGKMRVIFKSNTSVTGEGFDATYTSFPAGYEEYDILKDLKVFPNPSNDKLHVAFSNNNNEEVSVQIFDLKGQLVYSENHYINLIFDKDIDIADFAKGVYNLKIITSDGVVNKKVVFE